MGMGAAVTVYVGGCAETRRIHWLVSSVEIREGNPRVRSRFCLW